MAQSTQVLESCMPCSSFVKPATLGPEANMNEATEIISTFMEGLLKLFYSGGAAACHSQASYMGACTTKSTLECKRHVGRSFGSTVV